MEPQGKARTSRCPVAWPEAWRSQTLDEWEQRESGRASAAAAPGEEADGASADGLWELPVEPAERRPECSRCSRPQKVCLCPFLPVHPLHISTHLYIIQHPAETGHGTMENMAAEALSDPVLHVLLQDLHGMYDKHILFVTCGISLFVSVGMIKEHEDVKIKTYKTSFMVQLYKEFFKAGTFLPLNSTLRVSVDGDNELKYNNLNERPCGSFLYTLVSQIQAPEAEATKPFSAPGPFLLQWSLNCRRVQLKTSISSQYVIRTQPTNRCLSTLECAAVALSILEKNNYIQETLLRPLQALCSFQLQHGAQVRLSKEHLLRNGLYPKPMPKNKRKLRKMELLMNSVKI
ncbi:tRNA-uridine aminocarboxypropyltransferase 2 [Saccopteryx bilineata]|uniref:tRNA-uridine aminocarboxypropyltransferase 2 n=1 Tax=Saccopteryx bilineata TaxID=59482 RepID=UPI00338FA8A4